MYLPISTYFYLVLLVLHSYTWPEFIEDVELDTEVAPANWETHDLMQGTATRVFFIWACKMRLCTSDSSHNDCWGIEESEFSRDEMWSHLGETSLRKSSSPRSPSRPSPNAKQASHPNPSTGVTSNQASGPCDKAFPLPHSTR